MLGLYNAKDHTFIDKDGTVHSFFNGESEFAEEAMTLIKFKEGSLNLQEAYSILLRLARVPKTKFSKTESIGDAFVTIGADTLHNFKIIESHNGDN